MKEISEVSGIGRSSLYHYFSSVEEIYNEVVAEEKRKTMTNIESVENFLNSLKIELLNVDARLHRAVSEHYMANRANNCS